jgi:hypothetical protein
MDIEKFIKVRCVKKDYESKLILNKRYLVLIISSLENYYVYNENDVIYPTYLGIYPRDYFITLEDWRDSQLNKIL